MNEGVVVSEVETTQYDEQGQPYTVTKRKIKRRETKLSGIDVVPTMLIGHSLEEVKPRLSSELSQPHKDLEVINQYGHRISCTCRTCHPNAQEEATAPAAKFKVPLPPFQQSPQLNRHGHKLSCTCHTCYPQLVQEEVTTMRAQSTVLPNKQQSLQLNRHGHKLSCTCQTCYPRLETESHLSSKLSQQHRDLEVINQNGHRISCTCRTCQPKASMEGRESDKRVFVGEVEIVNYDENGNPYIVMKRKYKKRKQPKVSSDSTPAPDQAAQSSQRTSGVGEIEQPAPELPMKKPLDSGFRGNSADLRYIYIHRYRADSLTTKEAVERRRLTDEQATIIANLTKGSLLEEKLEDADNSCIKIPKTRHYRGRSVVVEENVFRSSQPGSSFSVVSPPHLYGLDTVQLELQRGMERRKKMETIYDTTTATVEEQAEKSEQCTHLVLVECSNCWNLLKEQKREKQDSLVDENASDHKPTGNGIWDQLTATEPAEQVRSNYTEQPPVEISGAELAHAKSSSHSTHGSLAKLKKLPTKESSGIYTVNTPLTVQEERKQAAAKIVAQVLSNAKKVVQDELQVEQHQDKKIRDDSFKSVTQAIPAAVTNSAQDKIISDGSQRALEQDNNRSSNVSLRVSDRKTSAEPKSSVRQSITKGEEAVITEGSLQQQRTSSTRERKSTGQSGQVVMGETQKILRSSLNQKNPASHQRTGSAEQEKRSEHIGVSNQKQSNSSMQDAQDKSLLDQKVTDKEDSAAANGNTQPQNPNSQKDKLSTETIRTNGEKLLDNGIVSEEHEEDKPVSSNHTNADYQLESNLDGCTRHQTSSPKEVTIKRISITVHKQLGHGLTSELQILSSGNRSIPNTSDGCPRVELNEDEEGTPSSSDYQSLIPAITSGRMSDRNSKTTASEFKTCVQQSEGMTDDLFITAESSYATYSSRKTSNRLVGLKPERGRCSRSR